jgi:hypothetical protein
MTRLDLYVTVLGKLLVAYEEQAYAVVRMSTAGVYREVNGTYISLLGVPLLEIPAAKRCHLRCDQWQPGKKAERKRTSRTTTSVCAASADSMSTGWLKHPSSRV